MLIILHALVDHSRYHQPCRQILCVLSTHRNETWFLYLFVEGVFCLIRVYSSGAWRKWGPMHTRKHSSVGMPKTNKLLSTCWSPGCGIQQKKKKIAVFESKGPPVLSAASHVLFNSSRRVKTHILNLQSLTSRVEMSKWPQAVQTASRTRPTSGWLAARGNLSRKPDVRSAISRSVNRICSERGKSNWPSRLAQES